MEAFSWKMATTPPVKGTDPLAPPPKLIGYKSLAEEKEMYLECLGHLMGLDFKPRSGLQLVTEGPRSTEELECGKVEISEGAQDVAVIDVVRDSDKSSVPSSGGRKRKDGGENIKSTLKDDSLLTVKDLSLEQGMVICDAS